MPGRHFGALSARCPPARRSAGGEPFPGAAGAPRERSPSAAARALLRGPALPARSPAPLPRSLLSAGAHPESLQSSQRSAASLLSVRQHFQQEGAARHQPEPAARAASGAGRAAGPARRGEPGPAAARDGGPGTDQGPNAAPGAGHAWGPLRTSRPARGPRAWGAWAPVPNLIWDGALEDQRIFVWGQCTEVKRRLLLILRGVCILQWDH